MSALEVDSSIISLAPCSDSDVNQNGNDTVIEVECEDSVKPMQASRESRPLKTCLNVVPSILFALHIASAAWYFRTRLVSITSGE